MKICNICNSVLKEGLSFSGKGTERYVICSKCGIRYLSNRILSIGLDNISWIKKERLINK